jgi:hypothetical protein
MSFHALYCPLGTLLVRVCWLFSLLSWLAAESGSEFFLAFRSVPRPTTEQYDSLKESIIQKGLLQNIEALADGTIVDGHTHFQICRELKIELPESKITRKQFESNIDTKLYIVAVNLQRRHLNNFQSLELHALNLDLYEEKAKQTQGTRTDLTSSPNGEKVQSFQVDKVLAAQSRVNTLPFLIKKPDLCMKNPTVKIIPCGIGRTHRLLLMRHKLIVIPVGIARLQRLYCMTLFIAGIIL